MSDASDRRVPVAWEALEDAFENNAPEVHSYLHLETGEVLRLVEGAADPEMHTRVSSDPLYVRVEPVSSREQYRWMERFIASVEDSSFRDKLQRSIDGKGAFRRFKDTLVGSSVERERWFQFRSERLRACMNLWLEAHRIAAVPRDEWRVPSADEVKAKAEPPASDGRRSRVDVVDELRTRLRDLVEVVPARDLDAAVAFLEFLRDRKRTSRTSAKASEEGSGEVRLAEAGDPRGKRIDGGQS
ncbi:MAG: UPF0158 family protein [Polyangiales bacterium]|nr:hypothetical protein [Myxococcales bacterium]